MVQKTHSPDPATLGSGAGFADHANGGYDPAPTGGTAGSPGAWTPSGARAPRNAGDAGAQGIVASPSSPWTAGQYIQGSTPGAPGECTWSGTNWVGGRAPLAEKKAEAKPQKSSKEGE